MNATPPTPDPAIPPPATPDDIFYCHAPDGCVCNERCPFPCWQRVGLTEITCCSGCAPLPEVPELEPTMAPGGDGWSADEYGRDT